jgi:hypothetical protein
MKELTIDEIKQVNGGVGPAVYGAIVLAGRIAASPAARAFASQLGAGFAGGVGGAAFKFIADEVNEKSQ